MIFPKHALVVALLVAAAMHGEARAYDRVTVMFPYVFDAPEQQVGEERVLAVGDVVLRQAFRPERTAVLDADVNIVNGWIHRPLSANRGDKMIGAVTANGQEYYCARERLRGMERMQGERARMWHCFIDHNHDGRFDQGGIVRFSFAASLPVSGQIQELVDLDVPYVPDPAPVGQYTSIVTLTEIDEGFASFAMAMFEVLPDNTGLSAYPQLPAVRINALPTEAELNGSRVTVLAATDANVTLRLDEGMTGVATLMRRR